MFRRLVFGVCQLVLVVFALSALPSFRDEPPSLVKIRLKGGRSIVGELIEQSRDGLKLRDLKSRKEVAYSQDDLLKVERDVADSQAIAVAGLPAFVAWKLSHEQVGSSAGKIAEIKPAAIYLTANEDTQTANEDTQSFNQRMKTPRILTGLLRKFCE